MDAKSGAITDIGSFRPASPSTAPPQHLRNTRLTVFRGSAFVGYPTRLSMSGLPTPKWIVECRNCSATIIHSEVGANRVAEDYLRPTVRKFSVLGEELECPKCKTKAKYIREDLKYRSK
jgi:hypothetical protein